MPMAISPSQLKQHLQRPTSILPLVVFRIGFGILMLGGTSRFVLNGWVDTFYVQPGFHFTYLSFDWVKPLPAPAIYAVFAAMALFSILITVGLFYRASAVAFFLVFTYVELFDKAFYLNHYYLVSLLSFLLIFLPAHRKWSLDALCRPALRADSVPAWCIDVLRLQISIVYVFAGIAKLNADWLFNAMPLTIWLRANTNFPLIGALFDQRWVTYLLSWGGAFYDLTIPFFLLWRKSRPFALFTVAVFHIMTEMLFPIGMFPWIMIVSSLIFLDEADYRAITRVLRRPAPIPSDQNLPPSSTTRRLAFILVPFFILQLLLPMRYLLYPGNVLWSEEGFRFSWRVMLVEKTGAVTFFVRDPAISRQWTVNPGDYLTRVQEAQMSFQPDMILQFAHFLADQFQQQGYPDVEVRAEAYVSFNGRASRLLIDPTVDLARESPSLFHKPWILP
jgi:hypothetical protein